MGLSLGSTATMRTPGLCFFRNSPTPVMVPPVPTPLTNTSTLPAVSRQISGPATKKGCGGGGGVRWLYHAVHKGGGGGRTRHISGPTTKKGGQGELAQGMRRGQECQREGLGAGYVLTLLHNDTHTWSAPPAPPPPSPVVRRCTSGLAGFSNCCRM